MTLIYTLGKSLLFSNYLEAEKTVSTVFTQKIDQNMYPSDFKFEQNQ